MRSGIPRLVVLFLLLTNVLILTACGGGVTDTTPSEGVKVTLDANLDSRSTPAQVTFDPGNEQSYNFAASFVVQLPRVQKLTLHFRKLGVDTPDTWSVHVAVDDAPVSRSFILHFSPDGSPDRAATRLSQVFESDTDSPLVIDFGEVTQYGARSQFFGLM